MNSKFKDVPLDDDTAIIGEREVKLAEYDALYQMWSWNGITAESLIFLSDDMAELSDAEIESLVRQSPFFHEESKMTIERSESGYIFTNFNFE